MLIVALFVTGVGDWCEAQAAASYFGLAWQTTGLGISAGFELLAVMLIATSPAALPIPVNCTV